MNTRDSLDKRLAHLSPDEQIAFLVHGAMGPGNQLEHLVMQTNALKLIGDALQAKRVKLHESEGYQELKRRVFEQCGQTLSYGDADLYRRLASAKRKVDSQSHRWDAKYVVRYALIDAGRAGPVNLTRLAEGLYKMLRIRVDVSFLSDLAHKLNVTVRPRGRPSKIGSLALHLV